MSGICSRHRHHESGCRLCNTEARDILPDFDRKLAEAEAAGRQKCPGCGFVYYRTVEACPLCGRPRPEVTDAGM